jgi:hypothetical protein
MSVEAVALAALGKYVAGLGKKWAKANARDLGEWRGSAAFTKVSDQVVRLFGLKEMLDLDPAAFKKTYHLHDSVYDEGGVWVRDPAIPKSDWVFVECERVFGDILMLWGLSAEGANNATLQAVYRAVRVAAGKAWENHGKIDNC